MKTDILRQIWLRKRCELTSYFFLTGMSDVNSDSSDADSASVAISLTASVLARIEKFSNLPVIKKKFTVIKTKDQLFLRCIWADKMRKKARKLAVHVFINM